MPEIRKLRVFLCHSSNDKPAVRELYKRLKAEGWIDPWLDEEKLLPGQDWDLEIEKAVEASDAVIVFLSNNSVSKEGYIQRELRFVLRIADFKPEGTVFVIPVRLDDCPMPRRLSMWQCVDYFPQNQKDWAYQRLFGSLKVRAKKLEISTTNPAEEQAHLEAEEKVKKEKEERREKEAANKAAKEKVEREVAKKAREEKIARENLETEEKTHQQKIPRIFFSAKGKHLLFVGGGIALLFALGYIISVIGLSGKFDTIPTPTIMPTVAPPDNPTVGSTWYQTIDGMTMVYVPAGEFRMGNEEHGENEKPVHAVYLDSYWIDQTEVTNTMYAHFLNIMGNQSSESGIPWLDASDNDVKIHQSNNIWQVDSEYENHPVIEVSWYGAQAYCEWAGRRLPTEAEWEKAAGWDDDLQSQQIFPWGDSFDAGGANFCDSNCPTGWRNENYDDGYQYTSPVGSYESGQSFYGAYDMAGNVWELVEDWYDAYQGNTVDDSDYGTTYKVLRGGSWDLTEYYLRPAFRVKSSPADADYDIGFRCVFSASE